MFIITSGAVASDPNKHRSKNLRAAIGQPRLMGFYAEYSFELGKVKVCADNDQALFLFGE